MIPSSLSNSHNQPSQGITLEFQHQEFQNNLKHRAKDVLHQYPIEPIANTLAKNTDHHLNTNGRKKLYKSRSKSGKDPTAVTTVKVLHMVHNHQIHSESVQKHLYI